MARRVEVEKGGEGAENKVMGTKLERGKEVIADKKEGVDGRGGKNGLKGMGGERVWSAW